MRTNIGLYLRNVQRDMRSFVVVSAMCAAVLYPIGTAGALPLAIDTPPVTIDTSPPDLSAPQQLELTPGTPTSTTPSDMKPSGAKLTWTPTGVGQIQDTYDVLLTRTSDMEEDELSGEVIVPGADLQSAELNIDGLAEGQYYWQVRSCAAGSICNAWSEVHLMTIDATAPGAPTAAVMSGRYDTRVVIAGSAEAASAISIAVEGFVCTTRAGEDGAWSCAFENEFEYGSYVAVVSATDKAGNQASAELEFTVKELFVAPPIVAEELPPVLEIAPVLTSHENKVYQQPISAVDSMSSGEVLAAKDENAPAALLTTDGGIVQSSTSGWKVLGLPWFIWALVAGVIPAGWYAVLARRLA